MSDVATTPEERAAPRQSDVTADVGPTELATRSWHDATNSMVADLAGRVFSLRAKMSSCKTKNFDYHCTRMADVLAGLSLPDTTDKYFICTFDHNDVNALRSDWSIQAKYFSESIAKAIAQQPKEVRTAFWTRVAESLIAEAFRSDSHGTQLKLPLLTLGVDE